MPAIDTVPGKTANWCCIVVMRPLPFNPLQDMKHTILTLTIASLLATTAFADPIHDAAKTGDLAGVQAELDKGADVNAKNESGVTPLLWAAWKGHKEVAELLIANGADVNAKNEDGETPLDFTKQTKQKAIADLLRKHGGKTGEELKVEGAK